MRIAAFEPSIFLNENRGSRSVSVVGNLSLRIQCMSIQWLVTWKTRYKVPQLCCQVYTAIPTCRCALSSPIERHHRGLGKISLGIMHLHLSVVYFSLFVTIIAGPFPQQTDLNADLDFNEANLNTEISDNPYQDPGTSGNYDQIASSGITDGSTIASQLATSNTGTDGNSLGAGDFSGASISTYYQSKLNMLVASSIRAKRRERGKNKQPQPQPQPQPQKAPSSNRESIFQCWTMAQMNLNDLICWRDSIEAPEFTVSIIFPIFVHKYWFNTT